MRYTSKFNRHRGRMLKEDYEHINPDFGAYLTKAFNDFILKEVIPPMKHALPNRNWKFKVMDDSDANNPLCKIIVAVGEGKSIPVVGVGWTDLTRKNGDTEQVNVLIWGNEGELIEFDFWSDDYTREIELKPTEFVKLFRYADKILSKETVRESRFHKGKVLREEADEYDFNPEAMERLRDAYDFEVARRHGSDYAFDKARDYVMDKYGYEWYELPESTYEYEEAVGLSIED